jgi:hypothetical protein
MSCIMTLVLKDTPVRYPNLTCLAMASIVGGHTLIVAFHPLIGKPQMTQPSQRGLLSGLGRLSFGSGDFPVDHGWHSIVFALFANSVELGQVHDRLGCKIWQ